jgi:hypothetical protein
VSGGNGVKIGAIFGIAVGSAANGGNVDTGHSLRDLGAILDAHYLSRDPRLAESVMKKKEAHEAGTKIPN